MKKLLIAVLTILPAVVFTQVTEEWVARYNGSDKGSDYAFAMALDEEGNVYVTGRSPGSGSGDDCVTIKYTITGEEQWVKRYNGTGNGADAGCAICTDGSRNVYVTGYTYDSSSHFDYLTIKYNPTGKEEWVARYNGPGDTTDRACSIGVDDAGNVYITGCSWDSTLYTDHATVKYNRRGEELWVARYDGPVNFHDEATALAVDDAGNVYVTGTTDLISDYATVKYNPQGEEEWVAHYDGTGSGWDVAYAIAIDGAGNVYVTGYSPGSGTDADYATIKYNPQGEEQWVARYNGPANGLDRAYDLVVDAAGNVFVTGASRDSLTDFDYATVKYNSQGEEQWVARYNGAAYFLDGAPSIALDDAGNVYITGYGYDSEDSPTDYVTIKYNPAGEEQWLARYNGPGNTWDRAYALAVDDAGNVYVTGKSHDSDTDYDYVTIKYSQETGITEESAVSPEYLLEVTQLTPEPTINYAIPSSQHISIKAYDVTGQLVQTLVCGTQPAGEHSIIWNTETSSGVYFVRLETPHHSASAKLIVR